MCLIAFAWQTHPRYDLIVAANRDEFYQRPTQAAHWWRDAASVYGGRDERAGGAWCAADRGGRFAAVTNVREPGMRTGLRSRGALVQDGLVGAGTLTNYRQDIARRRNEYGPFNLLLGDCDRLLFLSNRGAQQSVNLTPGVYAISNGHWDEDWPKTSRARQELSTLISDDNITPDTLFALLGESDVAPTERLPDTGVGPDTEQLLSALFVHSASYGTRASTLILRDRAGHMAFYERAFDESARLQHDIDEHWSIA